MPDPSSSSQSRSSRRRSPARPGDSAVLNDPRGTLAQTIPRRPGVAWWLGLVMAVGFAAVVTPAITAERWLFGFRPGTIVAAQPAPFTVRAPLLAGYENLRVRGGVVIARGEPATRGQATIADAIADQAPRGPVPYLAFFALTLVLGALFTHHLQRSTKGRLVRVQLVSLAGLAVLAVAVKAVLVATTLSALVVPVAVLAMIPTLVLDRTVGLATGVLAALVVSLLGPFDIGLAILLLVQAATAGLVIPERPKRRWAAALAAGAVTTLGTAATYFLLTYLTTGGLPELGDPLHATWFAAAIGPALAGVIAVPLVPVYQRLVGEITLGRLIALEDLGHPMLRQIAEKSPGTWQHSLMMANMAEIAANAIGASGRLVRVGAYFHDLGKSLSPKYFIENLEAGETSPHDQLPPEASCDAIFAHVTEGIVAARKAGLHERVIDFMHMHHGDGVLEYFWARCREQGNPHGFTIEDFRYPGHPPQSRETAILAICDAVEAASRTLKKPDPASIDALVQRIVYGKLHLGQLDESGLSMGDLRRISDSLRETIRHANHGRIEYPWQKAGQDASASVMTIAHSGSTLPRLDSLDRKQDRETPRPGTFAAVSPPDDSDAALANTADLGGGPAGPGASPPAAPAAAESSASYAAYAQGDAYGSRDVETVALRPEDRRDSNRDLRRDSDRDLRRDSDRDLPRDPTRDSSRDLGRAARPTERARPVRADDSGDAAPVEPSVVAASTLPNGLVQARDLGHGPGAERNAAATLPDGMTMPRDTAAATRDDIDPGAVREAGRPIHTLPDGVVPLRDVGATPIRRSAARAASQAAGRDIPTLPDGIVPVRTTAPAAPALRDAAASTQEGMGAARDPDAPVRRDVEPVATVASLTPPAPSPVTTLPGRPGALPPPPALITPQLFSGDASRAAGPPPRDDLDNATTNPPPLRRGPSGQPPVQGDPAQLAAALANLVQRVSAAPFGTSSEPRPGGEPASDAAITLPAMGRDLDSAVTAPRLDRAPDRAPDPAPGPGDRARSPTPGGLVVPPLGARAPGTLPRTSGLSEAHPRPRPVTPPRAAGADELDAAAEPGSGPTAGRRRAPTSNAPLPTRPPARVELDDEAQLTAPRLADLVRDDDSPAARARRAAEELDASVTEPSLPLLAIGDAMRVDLQVAPPAGAPRNRPPGWASGLAARIDAAIDSDEWGKATPVVPPTKAELRLLLGQPDPTREQPVDELELLQRRAAQIAAADAEAEPARRAPHPTAEVDPDDIEAAIEVAPPARKPTNVNAIGVSRPKKPE